MATDGDVSYVRKEPAPELVAQASGSLGYIAATGIILMSLSIQTTQGLKLLTSIILLIKTKVGMKNE